ncbi:hypothetical protein BDF19DRAFT_452223 [Syncephalis fuscata]|nr:hypothetical protein BDF19DRAFT_452223 [Syncephalis fuscata]
MSRRHYDRASPTQQQQQQQQQIQRSTATQNSNYLERKSRLPLEMSAQAPSFFDPAEFTIHSTNEPSGLVSCQLRTDKSATNTAANHNNSEFGTAKAATSTTTGQNKRQSATPPITSLDYSQKNILSEIFSSRSANTTPPGRTSSAYRDDRSTNTALVTPATARTNKTGLFTGGSSADQTTNGPSLPVYTRLPRHFHDLEYDGETSIMAQTHQNAETGSSANVPRTPAAGNITTLTGVPATPSFMKSSHMSAGMAWLTNNSTADNQSNSSGVSAPPTVQKTKAAQMTLKEQEKLLDERTKECFNLKLKIDKLETLMADLGPPDLQKALIENANYRVKVHELTSEVDRHQQLLLEARWAVETLQHQQQEFASNGPASIPSSSAKAASCTLPHRTTEDMRRQEEQEAELAITRRELQQLREDMGADGVLEERRQRQHDALRRENDRLQRELNSSLADREVLEQELRESEEALAVYQSEAEIAHEALGMVDSLEQENRFLRDQVAELTLELREKSDGVVVGMGLDEQAEMGETIERLHELLEREQEETQARIRELEQSHCTVLDEARDELNQAILERDELSYKLDMNEQQADQLKVSLKEIADERNQLSTSFKSVQTELKLLKQKTINNHEHQLCNEKEKSLLKQLDEAQLRNDELADICSKLDDATKQMDADLDAAYEQIHELETRPSPEEMNVREEQDKLKRERAAAREKLAELVDEREALERRVISMQERDDRIQHSARDYLEEIKTIRQTLSRNPINSNDNQGIQRSLDNVLQQLRLKQQELNDAQNNLRQTEEQYSQELAELRKKLRKSDTLVKQTLEQLELVNNKKGDIKAVLQSYGSLEQLEEGATAPSPVNTTNAAASNTANVPTFSQSATHLPGNSKSDAIKPKPNSHRRSMSYVASSSSTGMAFNTVPSQRAAPLRPSLHHRGQSQIPLDDIGASYDIRRSMDERPMQQQQQQQRNNDNRWQ